jgi:MFS family permease
MRRELKILLLAEAMFALAGGLFGPIYAIFVEEIGGDLLAAGGAYAAFALAAGILIFFISRWEDHVRHKEKLIVAGYLLNCVGFLAYIFIQSPLELFLVQIIFGVGTAVGAPAYDALYSKNLDKGKFTSEWGMWESMQFIVLAIAAGAGGFLATLYGFRFLFILMFLLSVLGLLVSLALFRKRGLFG